MALTSPSGSRASTGCFASLLVDDLPSSLGNRSPQENRAISHFIDATLPPDFALCIGIVPARTTAKEFFDAIKTRFCPGNRFQKVKVVKTIPDLLVENGAGQPKPNSAIILSLCKLFAIFKKLGIDADELEGLLAQAAFHAPPSLDCVAFDQLLHRHSFTACLTCKTISHPTLQDQWAYPAKYVAPLIILWTDLVAHAFTADVPATGKLTAQSQRDSRTQIHGPFHLGLTVLLIQALQTVACKTFPARSTRGNGFCK
ncbi:hypothetical protein O181_061551 [Austropuccinia psidii MF-1]|uniref:Uncharacterized protein n=1 Tax=Austropuccinia psidii MF-1 TaxID=1389203 RepID=A0A9Q3EGA6_9BASI|nr:hypothetical protein [Austropuccinia psidii MF-1]